jgi:hypothetical protein
LVQSPNHHAQIFLDYSIVVQGRPWVFDANTPTRPVPTPLNEIRIGICIRVLVGTERKKCYRPPTQKQHRQQKNCECIFEFLQTLFNDSRKQVQQIMTSRVVTIILLPDFFHDKQVVMKTVDSSARWFYFSSLRPPIGEEMRRTRNTTTDLEQQR